MFRKSQVTTDRSGKTCSFISTEWTEACIWGEDTSLGEALSNQLLAKIPKPGKKTVKDL